MFGAAQPLLLDYNVLSSPFESRYKLLQKFRIQLNSDALVITDFRDTVGNLLYRQTNGLLCHTLEFTLIPATAADRAASSLERRQTVIADSHPVMTPWGTNRLVLAVHASEVVNSRPCTYCHTHTILTCSTCCSTKPGIHSGTPNLQDKPLCQSC